MSDNASEKMSNTTSIIEFRSKINVLKNKLISALPRLKENQYFTIMLYHEKLFWWNKKLSPATKANIQEAQEYIKRIFPEGNTDTFLALQKAFFLEDSKDFYKNYLNSVDTIILISDGLPTTGEHYITYTNNEIKAFTLSEEEKKGLQKKKIQETLKFLDVVTEMNRLRCIKIHTIGIPPDALDDLLGGLAADSLATYQYWE